MYPLLIVFCGSTYSAFIKKRISVTEAGVKEGSHKKSGQGEELKTARSLFFIRQFNVDVAPLSRLICCDNFVMLNIWC